MAVLLKQGSREDLAVTELRSEAKTTEAGNGFSALQAKQQASAMAAASKVASGAFAGLAGRIDKLGKQPISGELRKDHSAAGFRVGGDTPCKVVVWANSQGAVCAAIFGPERGSPFDRGDRADPPWAWVNWTSVPSLVEWARRAYTKLEVEDDKMQEAVKSPDAVPDSDFVAKFGNQAMKIAGQHNLGTPMVWFSKMKAPGDLRYLIVGPRAWVEVIITPDGKRLSALAVGSTHPLKRESA